MSVIKPTLSTRCSGNCQVQGLGYIEGSGFVVLGVVCTRISKVCMQNNSTVGFFFLDLGPVCHYPSKSR